MPPIQRLIIVLLLCSIATAVQAANPDREPACSTVWKNKSSFDGVRKGWEHLEDGDHAKAEKAFSRVERKTRNRYERSQALFGQAMLRRVQGDTRAAIALYTDVLRLDCLPNGAHYAAMKELARLQHNDGDAGAALDTIRQWQAGNTAASADERAEVERLQAAVEGRVGPVARLDDPLQPLIRAQPEYPRKAAIGGVEGAVTVRATVDAEGRVTAVQIIDADPPGVFERATELAMARWRFEAPGREIQLTQTFEFQLAN